MNHPTALLAAYAGGSLTPEEAGTVAGHLAGCDACAAEVAAWETVARAARARASAVAPAPPGLFAAIQARLTGPEALTPYRAPLGNRPVARVALLLLRQPRLIGWPVWTIAAALLVAGTAVAAAAPPGVAGALLASVVPLAAALSVAGACGGTEDPAGELVAASPTPARAVLLARLTVVLAAVFVAAATASVALVGLRGGAATALLAAWLGPMVLLAAVSFALSALWRPGPAVGVALGVWVAQVLASTGVLHHTVAAWVAVVWRTDAPVLVVAAALVAGTLLLAPRVPARAAVRYGR